jgi:hypothetical protein
MRMTKPWGAKYRHSAKTPFVIEGLRVNGKRTRKFFGTRKEVESWLRLILMGMKREGEAAHA